MCHYTYCLHWAAQHYSDAYQGRIKCTKTQTPRTSRASFRPLRTFSGVSDANGCIFIAIAFRCALLGLWRQCALHSLSEYSSMVR
eukprot:8521-Heterococcus_DN1.PRE.4